MALPLMPKATAVWLVENTTLTFEQIAAFCGMHALEVQAIADGEVAVGIVGLDPVANGQVTREEILKGEQDQSHELVPSSAPDLVRVKQKGARYTPVAKRQDKPDAVAWLVRHHPDLSDAQIGKLIGTTKDTIAKVRDRTHWNTQNIKPRNPVTLGLCNEADLEKAVAIARHRAGHPPAEPGARAAAPVEETHEEHGEESAEHDAAEPHLHDHE
ncbi:MAG TPA: cell cycle transcriptional regulator TrcR [Magnetospirillaceae bacterium]|jgi:hypothetical protein